jgi:hypothetical protein
MVMASSSKSPVSAKQGIPAWCVAALICGAAGIALIIASFVPAGSKSVGASRLTVASDSAASDRSASGDTGGDPGEVVRVVSGFQVPPAWVPIYADEVNATHGTRSDEHGVVKGITTLETSDPLDKIKDYYKGKLTDEGFELTVDSSVTRAAEHAEIAARKDGGKMTVRAIMHRTNGRTTVNVDYTDTEHAEAGVVVTSSAGIAAGAPTIPGTTVERTQARESLPVWVPVYPTVKGELHVAANPSDDVNRGTLDFASTDSVARVREFYYARFKEAGYSVDSGAGSLDGVESAVLKAKKDGGRFDALVTITAEEGNTHIRISFAGKL